MDLSKNGALIRHLRKSKNMTQKQLAQQLGIEAKTVSKWETGHGFPDISLLSALADILETNEKTLIQGSCTIHAKQTGNMRNTKFHVCPHCDSVSQSIGQCQIFCCGKPIPPLSANCADDKHSIYITQIENDFYIEFHHEMSKEHFIAFAAYVGIDRTFIVRLYPEQDASVRIPQTYSGKLYYYCNQHGLFEYNFQSSKRT